MSIENDAGGSEISSKIIRLFVPYWLRNDTSIPLSCRLVEIEPPNSKYTDLNWLQLAIKAAENNESLPEGDKRQDKSSTLAKKIIRSIETIEDAQPNEPIMLSLPAMDNIGLAVAMNPKGMFSSAIALKAFEDKVIDCQLNIFFFQLLLAQTCFLSRWNELTYGQLMLVVENI